MKTLTKEEAIIAMVRDKKQVTSDEFDKPDEWYVFYSPQGTPFQLKKDNKIYIFFNWGIKEWRLRKYTPKDKELVYCWNDSDKAIVTISYYDAKSNSTFDHKGNRFSINFHNYAPYTGELPPNMCTVEELEE